MRTLIVDGNNLFIRCITVVPELDGQGSPIGGLVGSLRSLNLFANLCKPDRIFVVFDGENGSKKRRALDANYKQGKKPIKFGKHVHVNSVDIEQNIKYQFQRLQEYLRDLPVYIFKIDNVEADDVIAYLSNHFKDDQKVIASADKDFHQLLDEKTIIYKPQKKVFYTKKNCIDEYRIHPHNFSVAKSMVGDKSDNIKGPKGFGYKTVLKHFPFLSEEKKIELDFVFEFCKNNLEKNERYKDILNNKDLVINNLKLIQLENSIMGLQSIVNIKRILEQQLKLNITRFKIKTIKDGLKISEYFLDNFRRFIK